MISSLLMMPYGFMFFVIVIIKLIFCVGFIASRPRPLSKIPGPWWARHTRFWLVKTLASGRSQQIFIDVNRKHGRLHVILSPRRGN